MIRTTIAALTMAVTVSGAALAQSVPPPPVKPEHAAYAAEIAAAQTALDNFITAFNSRDVAAVDATFHFPHVRLASGRVTILQPGDQKPSMYASAPFKEWNHSGWARREVIHAGKDKVQFDTRFNRYRKDGSLIGGFDSIYIVTRVDGRWAIQARSSYAQ